RRRSASAIDRRALVETVEGGLAAPCATWAAPSVAVWPASGGVTPPKRAVRVDDPLRLLVEDAPRERRLARALAAQIGATGLEVEVVAETGEELSRRLADGDYDLRIERTWGVPYDPYVSLTNRFLLPSRARTAATDRFHGADPEVSAWVERATRTPDPADLPGIYAAIQARLDDAAGIVPLYAPHRLAVARPGLVGLELDHDLYHLALDRVGRAE
ncbi:MAG: hypothetical protein ACF8XB_16570, partial [Planctomycetota bacterium JB042]